MLSTSMETPTGIGDPESDVPPELFNDLEGKLDTKFASARAQIVPDPKDMEPAEPRDDFQIEQKIEAPSSRMDQSVLDVLRAEAEYSSGEKPPAVADNPPEELVDDTQPSPETIEVPADVPTEEPESPSIEDVMEDIPEVPVAETIEPEPEPPVVEAAEPEAEQPPADDELDEIRRRIMDLEVQEDRTEPKAPAADHSEILVETPEFTDADNDVHLPDLDTPTPVPEPVDQPAQEPTPPPTGSNPFSRPTAGTPRASDSARETVAHTPEPVDPEPLDIEPSQADVTEPSYVENIPFEEDIAAALAQQDHSVDDAIESLVAEQVEAETAQDSPLRKPKARAFPNVDSTTDELYGASGEPIEARKDMFPDVDQLSSEIAHDAEQGDHAGAGASAKSSGGFLKGIKYAVLFCLVIGVLYLVAPILSEYVPQTAGVLNVITNVVDTIARLLGPLVGMVKELI